MERRIFPGEDGIKQPRIQLKGVKEEDQILQTKTDKEESVKLEVRTAVEKLKAPRDDNINSEMIKYM